MTSNDRTMVVGYMNGDLHFIDVVASVTRYKIPNAHEGSRSFS